MKKNLLKGALSFAVLLATTSCGASGPRIPIVCGESGMNDICGVATLGVDYYNLGIKAGDMAADILLDEKDPATMPVQFDTNPTLSLNNTVAQEIGFTIPELNGYTVGEGSSEVERKDDAIVTDKEAADFKIGIIQLVQHTALDKCNVGFIDQLSLRMFTAGKTVYISNQNAAGDNANNTTICSTFVAAGDSMDLIYSIATSSSQAAVNATKENDIPVIFNAVTDPVTAGLVTSNEEPGANVTGVSDMNPVASQIKLIGDLLGNKENIKVGLLYTSAEVNSVYQITLAKDECNKLGFTYVDKGISDINDIQNAFISLEKAGVDAIYIPTDNTLANGAANIHKLNIGD